MKSSNLKSLLEGSTLHKKLWPVVPFFVKELSATEGKDTAITLGWFVDNWNKRNRQNQITDPDGRRIIRFIRNNAVVPRLMADHYGYFVAGNSPEFHKYLNMLERKLHRLNATLTALKKQYR